MSTKNDVGECEPNDNNQNFLKFIDSRMVKPDSLILVKVKEELLSSYRLGIPFEISQRIPKIRGFEM
ncbi:hypothetical protein CEXT_86901 [Caerostris extrusa]|uniref:Uncharacterized protein n=1 Tax=Caerostris extrusa TaxID=172846 RepID=A0AAV4SNY9_CAEEX|nr:hypothetical protein CEXT_86901 [Caerostris extrusa]